jgi:hypothetical protein
MRSEEDELVVGSFVAGCLVACVLGVLAWGIGIGCAALLWVAFR